MRRLYWSVPALVLLLSACSSDATDSTTTTGQTSPDPTVSIVEDPDGAGSGTDAEPTELPSRLVTVTSEWETNFDVSTIDLEELKVGIRAIDPRDLIPPIDDPVFEAVGGSDWLDDREPGAVVEVGGSARFYPLSIMTRHEIVNDDFDGTPVVVTYCPLCNTALAFDPVVDGTTLRFGVSGLLRQSDLVMWDDATESLWQQITGESIVGDLAGSRLEPVPSAILSWADFRERHSDGLVMAAEQGFGIPYGANPYVGYSSSAGPIGSFFDGEVDDRYPALSRVVGVGIEQEDVAYPFHLIEAAGAINDQVDGEPIVVIWGAPETADALDASSIANGRSVGTGVAYLSTVDGDTLTFAAIGDDRFVDEETGTTWTLLGDAIEGPLAGSRLQLAPHRNEFWFAFQAFFPDARVWQP